MRGPKRFSARLARRAIALLLVLCATGLVPSRLEAQAGRGIIAGTVRDSAGDPVVGAELRAGSAAAPPTLSGATGRFRIAGVPVGSTTVVVRRLGYRPLTAQVSVDGDGDTPLEVRLVPLPFQLTPVVVREHREPYDSRLAGFRDRIAHRRGYFITRERIDRTNSFVLTDLLREIPGVRIVRNRSGTRSVRLRSADCPPLVFVDGFPASAGEFDLDIIDPASVEGVEIYPGLMDVPPELVGPGSLSRCGVVAVWSRPARPKVRRVAQDENPVDLAALAASHAVLTADEVDQPAKLEQGSADPIYPDSLWRARIGGRLVAEFVVDSGGVPEMATFAVVTATTPAFIAAVREAVSSARFTPARRDGRAVRQIVQLPFVFTPPPASDRRPQ